MLFLHVKRLELDKPPHPVMHLGMTGWIRVKDAQTHYTPTRDESVWPPRFMKFILKTDAKPTDVPENCHIPNCVGSEVAFVDARRLGRIRLIDACDPMTMPPLSELGFDPVLSLPPFDKFVQQVISRRVPIKALLLDQRFSAGVGNWIADEVLYQSCIHPEQYTETLEADQLQELYTQLHIVCSTAAKVLGDSSKFPENWLFSYRWNKGKKDKKNLLPSGETIKFITAAGRTSAVVESRQKIRRHGKATKPVKVDGEENTNTNNKNNNNKNNKKLKIEDDLELEPPTKKTQLNKLKSKRKPTPLEEEEGKSEKPGRRRSARLGVFLKNTTTLNLHTI